MRGTGTHPSSRARTHPSTRHPVPRCTPPCPRARLREARVPRNWNRKWGDGGTRAVAHGAGPRGRWAWQGSGTMGASPSISPGQPGPTCQAHPTPHLIGTGMSSSISASTSPLGACPQTQSPKPATEPAPRLPWQMRTRGSGRWDAPWQKFPLAEEALGQGEQLGGQCDGADWNWVGAKGGEKGM